ncbi:MAG: glycosyltransferase family 1 protein [Halothece sp. Uz-M2-17]|nr:glycosyltransferase family 1 protein [Halothece sp. Uz-M2-17]
MHILIVALHRADQPTGVCRHGSGLARCLTDLNAVDQITLVIGSWQRDYFAAFSGLSSPKINLIDVEIKNNSIARNLWFLFQLPRLVKEQSPDLVHLSFPLPVLRSRFDCPIVATIHDLYAYDFPDNFGRLRAKFNQLIFQQCVTHVDGLTCVSKTTRERLIYYFPSVKKNQQLNITYNYVDFSNSEPKLPDFFRHKGNLSFILTVAQHRKNKNLDLLFAAFSELKIDHKIPKDTELIVVGSPGPETENLRQQIDELELQDTIHLLSKLRDRELQWLYINAQLFVIPSATEGFCLPLAEALYFSTPCVCSNIPILQEIGGSECTYFDLSNTPTLNLKQAIIQTLPVSSHSTKIPPTQFPFSKRRASQSYLQFYSEVIETNFVKNKQS